MHISLLDWEACKKFVDPFFTKKVVHRFKKEKFEEFLWA